MTDQSTQLEAVRAQAELVIGGPLDDADLDRIEKTAPAFHHLVESRASGRLAGGRGVTDRYLRRLPEELFNHLVAQALGFFRQGAPRPAPLDVAPEMVTIATFLYLGEDNSTGFEREPEDDHFNELSRRLVYLVLVEEQRRAGAFAWINHYSLLRPPSDDWPARLPIEDRATEH